MYTVVSACLLVYAKVCSGVYAHVRMCMCVCADFNIYVCYTFFAACLLGSRLDNVPTEGSPNVCVCVCVYVCMCMCMYVCA